MLRESSRRDDTPILINIVNERYMKYNKTWSAERIRGNIPKIPILVINLRYNKYTW